MAIISGMQFTLCGSYSFPMRQAVNRRRLSTPAGLQSGIRGIAFGLMGWQNSYSARADFFMPLVTYEGIQVTYNTQSAATYLQYTCTEIIAGYDDGNICTWGMKSGKLMPKISVKRQSGNGFPVGVQ